MAKSGDLEANSYQEKTQDRKVLLIFRKKEVKPMPLKSSESNNWREVIKV
jgi:hypothetical protein